MPNDLSEDPTMSVPEAGRLLGVSPKAAYAAAKQGHIPVIRVGKYLRVPKVALQRLLETGEQPNKAA